MCVGLDSMHLAACPMQPLQALHATATVLLHMQWHLCTSISYSTNSQLLVIFTLILSAADLLCRCPCC